METAQGFCERCKKVRKFERQSDYEWKCSCGLYVSNNDFSKIDY